MKTYRATLAVFEDKLNETFTGEAIDLVFTGEAIDLVNVDDENDRLFADPDSFTVGELVTEDEIYLEPRAYVDENNYGTCFFAFKKEEDLEDE
jgi:hypothetical protein